ncbi:MAG: universal stress protein [Desulfobacterales bacterium]|jgi:nucleotide-binding universal stress UspA family protein
MTAPRQIRRVLVALDGSQRSLETMRRLGEIDALKGLDVTLIHIFTGFPGYLLEVERDPTPLFSARDIEQRQTREKRKIGEWMAHARNALIRSGFAETHVESRIEDLKVGVARDLLAEAARGYDALVIRRRGMSKMASLILGSISSKLLEAATFIPLLISGNAPFSGNILIAMDGSENAMRAVEFVGDAIQGSCQRLVLAHVMRKDMSFDTIEGSPEKVPENVRHAMKQACAERFEKAAEILQQRGFSRRQIRMRFLPDRSSRSETLVRLAAEEGCSIISAGRKGRSDNSDFPLGGVVRKLVHLARDHSIWIVH